MCLSRFSRQRHPISPEKVRELVEYLFSETSKNNSSLMICNSLRTLTQQETKQVGHHWCPWKTFFPACDSYSFFHHFISVCACSKPALRRPLYWLRTFENGIPSSWIVIIPNVLLRIIRWNHVIPRVHVLYQSTHPSLSFAHGGTSTSTLRKRLQAV